MIEDLVIEPMTKDFILWRCLHGGALSKETIEQCPAEGPNWKKRRAINVPLAEKLIETYGTCAIVTRNGAKIIGSVRFYPKWLFSKGYEGMCFQQDYPCGPDERLVEMQFPPLEELEDKTLKIHCLMAGPQVTEDNPYRRKGVGSQMVRTLINWATEKGWEAIEATAYEGLNIIYSVSGAAGQEFWKKLGFVHTATEIEPALEEDNDFTRQMREEAIAAGLDPARIKNKYLMRLDLS